MPVYEYRCLDGNCGTVQERLVPTSARNDHPGCGVCGGPTARVVALPSIERWQPHDPRLKRNHRD